MSVYGSFWDAVLSQNKDMEYLIISRIVSVLDDIIIVRQPHFSLSLPMTISMRSTVYVIIIFDSPQVLQFCFKVVNRLFRLSDML